MDQELVDRIYESSFVPELWPGVLTDLVKITGANTGWLCVSNGEVQDCAASSELAMEVLRPLVESGWIARSQRFNRLLAARHAGFLVDYDLYTAEEMDNDPAYRDMLRPRGLGWTAATAISLPTGDNLALIMERAYRRGPVERAVVQKLDELRPHLARSALMSARLQLERARIASETLAVMGLPALV
ncbi:MAG: helix-turn-helix transcriptional regulator, partial [Candidatus Acidiferrales bacterium]